MKTIDQDKILNIKDDKNIIIKGKNMTTGGRKINWAGYTWQIMTGSGDSGPNNWSDSTNNVWVDSSNNLHLKITNVGGNWYCVNMNTGSFDYGTFTFHMVNNPSSPMLDNNTVMSGFYWNGDTNELDIEYAKWGNASETQLGQYTIQPNSLNLGKNYSINVANTTNIIAYQSNGNVNFSTTDSSGKVIGSYNANHQIATGGVFAFMLWLYDPSGRGYIGPSDGVGKEMILSNFTYTTTSPVIKYKCSGSPNYQCTSDNGDGTGTYATLTACQAACTTPIPTRYNCSGAPNYTCVATSNGQYATLAACQAACMAPTPTNLVQNPGFETASTTNPNMTANWWTWYSGKVVPNFSYPQSGRIGGNSVEISYASTGPGAIYGQNIPLRGLDLTKKYTLSGWVKTQNIQHVSGAGGGACIQIDWFRNNNSVFISSIVTSNFTGTVWTQLSKSGITIPPNADTVRILCKLSNCTGKAWFDDVSLN